MTTNMGFSLESEFPSSCQHVSASANVSPKHLQEEVSQVGILSFIMASSSIGEIALISIGSIVELLETHSRSRKYYNVLLIFINSIL